MPESDSFFSATVNAANTAEPTTLATKPPAVISAASIMPCSMMPPKVMPLPNSVSTSPAIPSTTLASCTIGTRNVRYMSRQIKLPCSTKLLNRPWP